MESRDTPVERLREALEALAPELRRACKDQVIANAPRLLRRQAEHPDDLSRTARRMREVFGGSASVKKAAELLGTGAAYLQSGRDETALLTLPVEQRELLIETCGEPAKPAGKPARRRGPR